MRVIMKEYVQCTQFTIEHISASGGVRTQERYIRGPALNLLSFPGGNGIARLPGVILYTMYYHREIYHPEHIKTYHLV